MKKLKHDKNIALVIIDVPKKIDTPDKVDKYLKKRGVISSFSRWVYLIKDWTKGE